jgi:small nuclear ribonucleoprotein (snRNP)-like protein
MASSTTSTPSNSPAATQYLSTFLNRTLHLHTTDGRMFAGQMKCTDPERNIILSMTHEYRQPSAQDIQLAAQRHERAGKSGNVKVDMKKRFVGLVVVPGKYITKIEVEE